MWGRTGCDHADDRHQADWLPRTPRSGRLHPDPPANLVTRQTKGLLIRGVAMLAASPAATRMA